MEVLDPIRRSFTTLAANPLLLKLILLSLCAAVSSTLLTALLIKVATIRGWVVIPSHGRWNRRIVAQFGGGPVLLTFWSVAMFLPGSQQLAAVLLAMIAMGLLGLVDDIKGLGPKPKLIVETVVALAVVYSGVVLPVSSNSIINKGLTLLWIIAITNAFNIIDNMDGLAGGTAIIALSGIALLSGVSTPFGMASILLMIALAGFFIFNFNPAKIFMGDLGALPIGFFLACASAVAGAVVPRRGATVFIPCVVLAVAIFDVLLVSVTRRLKGRAVSQGARDHSSHRLVFLGMTERGAVAMLHLLGLLSGALAFFWATVESNWIMPALVLYFVVLSQLWSYLAEITLPESWLSKVIHPAAPALVSTRSKAILAAVREFGVLAFAIYCAASVQPDHEQLGLFNRFGLVAGMVCLLRFGFLSAQRIHRYRHSSAYAATKNHNVQTIVVSACLFVPCWFLDGLSSSRTLWLGGWDVLLTTGLLLCSEFAGAIFHRFSLEPDLSVIPAAALRSRTLSLSSHVSSGHDFPRLAATQEVGDELEL